jgi:vacuolar-type H+-ATPase subunit D/Vma8
MKGLEMVKTNFFIKLLFFLSIFAILAICQSILDLSATFSDLNGISLSKIEAVEIAPTHKSVYVVKQGESIFDIANQSQTTVEQILKLNQLEDNPVLYEGQVIYLPDSEALYSLRS